MNSPIVFRADIEIEDRVAGKCVHVAMDALHGMGTQMRAGTHDAPTLFDGRSRRGLSKYLLCLVRHRAESVQR